MIVHMRFKARLFLFTAIIRPKCGTHSNKVFQIPDYGKQALFRNVYAERFTR